MWYADPMVRIPLVRAPVLVIDVEHEELWDRGENGRRAFELAARAEPRSRYHVVRGAKHYDAYLSRADECRQLALEFFLEHLAGGAPAAARARREAPPPTGKI